MRMLQTSLALPVIGAAHRTELERGRHRLYMVLGGMAVMMIVLGILLLVLRREMRRMKLLQQHLEGANSIKEMYMSQFLNLCTIYMDKLNQFCKIAERKISTGHTDDLYRMTKSGKFVEEQSREFYDTFDKCRGFFEMARIVFLKRQKSAHTFKHKKRARSACVKPTALHS